MPKTPENVIEIWKQVVAVQQHFNEIEMRIRGLFITIIIGIFFATGFLLSTEIVLNTAHADIHAVLGMPLLGIFATWMFYFADRHWYHRVLLGSVLHGIEIEKAHFSELPELSLSKTIGDASPYTPTNGLVRMLGRISISDDRFYKNGVIHSDAKIDLFYIPVLYFFALCFLVFLLFGGVKYEHRALLEMVIQALHC